MVEKKKDKSEEKQAFLHSADLSYHEFFVW